MSFIPACTNTRPIAAATSGLRANEVDVLFLKFDLVGAISSVKIDTGAFGDIAPFRDGIAPRHRHSDGDVREQRSNEPHDPAPNQNDHYQKTTKR